VEAASELSARHQAPVAMHLAESWEEMELLSSGSGPLVDFLSSLGAWHAGAVPRGIAPRDYLERLSRAHRALVIHGTFLTEDDWRLLADRQREMSVVYCPRTHEFFGRGPYPLAEMLVAGVRVALGTDSRASNPDLSLFAEAKHVVRRHGDVSPEAVLRMATLDSATALGLGEHIGSLTSGKVADMAAIRLPERPSVDPCELIFDDESEVVGVWRQGQCLGEAR
jgi:cytosine/adenosine deaminase-related metal-dependent hydrolase